MCCSAKKGLHFSVSAFKIPLIFHTVHFRGAADGEHPLWSISGEHIIVHFVNAANLTTFPLMHNVTCVSEKNSSVNSVNTEVSKRAATLCVSYLPVWAVIFFKKTQYTSYKLPLYTVNFWPIYLPCFPEKK